MFEFFKELIRLFNHSPLAGNDFPTYSFPLMEEPFQQSGELPLSVKLSGDFYRWHKQRYFFKGSDFYKSFEDVDKKWDEAERFAGKGLNCGHFLSRTPAAAAAEVRFYNKGNIPQNRILLGVKGTFDRILDLTHPANIEQAFREWLTLANAGPALSGFWMLRHLVDCDKGGTDVTDYIGFRATQLGYDGVLFFSARAIDQLRSRFEASPRGGPDDTKDVDGGLNYNLEGLVRGQVFADLRRNQDILNVVLFHGARSVSRIERYSPDGGQTWEDNPLHGVSESSILEKSSFGEQYQAQRKAAARYDKPPGWEWPA